MLVSYLPGEVAGLSTMARHPKFLPEPTNVNFTRSKSH
jgi:hypothetical protein